MIWVLLLKFKHMTGLSCLELSVTSLCLLYHVLLLRVLPAWLFCCYNIISVLALSGGITPSNVSWGIFSNVLNVMIYNFLCTQFVKDLTWSLFLNLCPFKTQHYIEQGTLTIFSGRKNGIYFQTFLFKLSVWVKMV